jgi:CrcB protein
MRDLLLVGSGGFLGSVCRYYLGGIVMRSAGAPRFPVGTATVNITGCLLIGLLAGLAETAHLLTPPARLFLLTGFLGGYTTFSAFAYETYFLGREQAWSLAVVNVGLQVSLGLAAVIAGHRLSGLFAS